MSRTDLPPQRAAKSASPEDKPPPCASSSRARFDTATPFPDVTMVGGDCSHGCAKHRPAVQKPFQVRTWRDGDDLLLEAAASQMSLETRVARFHGIIADIRTSYLDVVTGNWPAKWNAVLAVSPSGSCIGWADYGRSSSSSAVAEAAVCVIDPCQRRGVGSALVVALAELALANGVATAVCDVAPSNVAAERLARLARQLLGLSVRLDR